MNDNNGKKNEREGCTVVVERHGPNCPITQGFKAVAEELMARTGEVADGEKGGPAKYNSSAYRSGWESIFGKRHDAGQA